MCVKERESLCTFTYFVYAADLLVVFPCRLLQISSFNGKMNALNEVNKVIASVTYYPHRHTGLEEEEWLTAERMAVSNTVCCYLAASHCKGQVR